MEIAIAVWAIVGWVSVGCALILIQKYARAPDPSKFPFLLGLTHTFLWPVALIKCRKWRRFGGHECFFTRHADMTKATEFWGPDRKGGKVKR